MRKFRCPKCPRTYEGIASEVSCPPMVAHPKGWGAHVKTVWMVEVKTEKGAA